MSKKQDNGDDWDQQRDEVAGDGIVVKTIGTMVVLLLGLVGWVTYMDGMWKIDGMSKIGKDGLVKKSFDISKLKITFPSKENKNTAINKSRGNTSNRRFTPIDSNESRSGVNASNKSQSKSIVRTNDYSVRQAFCTDYAHNRVNVTSTPRYKLQLAYNKCIDNADYYINQHNEEQRNKRLESERRQEARRIKAAETKAEKLQMEQDFKTNVQDHFR